MTSNSATARARSHSGSITEPRDISRTFACRPCGNDRVRTQRSQYRTAFVQGVGQALSLSPPAPALRLVRGRGMTDIPLYPAAIRRPPYMIATIALAAIGVPVVSISLLRLRPAGLVVDRSSVWTDTVRRGSMLREVHGSGTLTPEDVRWLAAATEARVDRIVIRPGAAVQADSDIVELTSPEVEQSAVEAGLALRAAEADLASRTVALRSDLLAQRSVAARAREELQEIRLKLAADERLANAGLHSALELQLSHARAEELTSRVAIEDERVTFAQKTLDAQLTALRSRLDQLRSITALRDKQRDALHVRAGLDGVLQQVAVQVGQRVTAGTPLAKVARPEPLRAELRIAETEARDIQL